MTRGVVAVRRGTRVSAQESVRESAHSEEVAVTGEDFLLSHSAFGEEFVKEWLGRINSLVNDGALTDVPWELLPRRSRRLRVDPPGTPSAVQRHFTISTTCVSRSQQHKLSNRRGATRPRGPRPSGHQTPGTRSPLGASASHAPEQAQAGAICCRSAFPSASPQRSTTRPSAMRRMSIPVRCTVRWVAAPGPRPVRRISLKSVPMIEPSHSPLRHLCGRDHIVRNLRRSLGIPQSWPNPRGRWPSPSRCGRAKRAMNPRILKPVRSTPLHNLNDICGRPVEG